MASSKSCRACSAVITCAVTCGCTEASYRFSKSSSGMQPAAFPPSSLKASLTTSTRALFISFYPNHRATYLQGSNEFLEGNQPVAVGVVHVVHCSELLLREEDADLRQETFEVFAVEFAGVAGVEFLRVWKTYVEALLDRAYTPHPAVYQLELYLIANKVNAVVPIHSFNDYSMHFTQMHCHMLPLH